SDILTKLSDEITLFEIAFLELPGTSTFLLKKDSEGNYIDGSVNNCFFFFLSGANAVRTEVLSKELPDFKINK
ncbi:MAG: hypothetical protein GY853_01970, partial [PVC group bacterium]|nr:hypothetical protein [PVC group bacterium]